MVPEILTATGKRFNFDRPDRCDFGIGDIAHALSNLCRFTGHTKDFYSVAQHSVLVSLVVAPEYALEALLHDASEAFIGDVSSPLKSVLSEYREIERRVDAEIRRRFGLPERMSPEVKRADLLLLAVELRDLMPEGWWRGLDPDYSISATLSPPDAKERFLQRYEELMTGESKEGDSCYIDGANLPVGRVEFSGTIFPDIGWKLSGVEAALKVSDDAIGAVREFGGVVRTFESGATRDLDEDKIQYARHLSPRVLRVFCEYMHEHRKTAAGMRAPDNWKNGIDRQAYLDSLWRHLHDLWVIHSGEGVPDGGTDKQEALCGIIFNAMGYLFEETRED